MEIGMKIYYDKATGNIILNTGERQGDVIAITWEQDFTSYKSLAERVPETVGVIHLEYGQHTEDFVSASGYRVNPDTQELEFSYDDVNNPETPPVYQHPLSLRVTELEQDSAALLLSLVEGGIL